MDVTKFAIEDFSIVTPAPGRSYYIREILDWPSQEFCSSSLRNQEKLEVIEYFGAPRMTQVLAECFAYAGKSYNAEQTVACTMAYLRRTTPGSKGA